MAYRVFVSHASKDREWIEWITQQAGSSITFYLAEHDLQLGKELAVKIQSQISKSHALIVFLTDATESAAFVHQEVGWAMKANKLVIPVVQEGIGEDQLGMLKGLEYLIFDFSRPEAGQRALMQHLRGLALQKAAKDLELQKTVMLIGALALIGLVAYNAN
jgi:TIR domain